jgi:hypothetical protein
MIAVASMSDIATFNMIFSRSELFSRSRQCLKPTAPSLHPIRELRATLLLVTIGAGFTKVKGVWNWMMRHRFINVPDAVLTRQARRRPRHDRSGAMDSGLALA